MPAGRNRIPKGEKKQICAIYIERKIIDKLGGDDSVKQIAKDAIMKKYVESLDVEL